MPVSSGRICMPKNRIFGKLKTYRFGYKILVLKKCDLIFTTQPSPFVIFRFFGRRPLRFVFRDFLFPTFRFPLPSFSPEIASNLVPSGQM